VILHYAASVKASRERPSGGPGLDFSHFLCDKRRSIRGLNKRTLAKLRSFFFFAFVLPQPGSVQLEPGHNADIRCTEVDSDLDMEDAISYRLQQKGGSRVVTRRGCTVQKPHPASQPACRLIKDDLTNCICGVGYTSGSLCRSGLITAQRVGCGWTA
jgi:hypothetical protein